MKAKYALRTRTSGVVGHSRVGVLIGSIRPGFHREIRERYSVLTGEEMVWKNPVGILAGNPSVHEISGNLSDIRGKLFHCNGTQQWDSVGLINSPIMTFNYPNSPNTKPHEHSISIGDFHFITYSLHPGV